MDLKEETQKMLVEIARNLVKVISSNSFEFWSRKDFRIYLDFDHISQVEHDRIFNELLVSTLGLFALTLEYAAKTSYPDYKSFLLEMKKNLVS